jgi:hypothetical protein
VSIESEFRRDRMVAVAIEALETDVYGPGDAEAAAMFEQAVAVVDALVDANLLIPSERWDEDCHSCEQLVRHHTIGGDCPPQPKEDDV